MDTVLLLDGDLISYRFAAEAEKAVEFEPGEWTRTADFDVATRNCNRYINQMLEKFEAADYILAITDRHNFRRDLMPSYKAHRKRNQKPILMGAMLEWLNEQPKVVKKRALEADDVMGIIATSPLKFPDKKKIMVSIDKDMEQIPGWLYNPMKDKKARYISEPEANRFHLWQTLVGDKVDGFPGLPTVGPVRADKILDLYGDPWENIVEAFKSKGQTEEHALLQARLARILRREDYDFEKKEPILWTP